MIYENDLDAGDNTERFELVFYFSDIEIVTWNRVSVGGLAYSVCEAIILYK